MYVIIVRFTLKDGSMDAFLPLMQTNAAQSVAQEPGCHQFDVCRDPDDPLVVFLYEVYDDAAAFQQHMASPHFKAFDAATGPMIATKDVQSYERLAL